MQTADFIDILAILNIVVGVVDCVRKERGVFFMLGVLLVIGIVLLWLAGCSLGKRIKDDNGRQYIGRLVGAGGGAADRLADLQRQSGGAEIFEA